jgi:hypothetical protein
MAATLTLVRRKPAEPSPELRAQTKEVAHASIETEAFASLLDTARELWRTHRELVEQDEDPVPGLMALAKEEWEKFEVLRHQWPDGGRQRPTTNTPR